MKYPGVALLLSLAAMLHARPQMQNCWPPQSCTQNMGQPFGNDFPFGNNGGQPFGNKLPFTTSGQDQANQQGVQNCRCKRDNNEGANNGGANNNGESNDGVKNNGGGNYD